MSMGRVVKEMEANHLSVVDSREWSAHWKNRWVVYADLIAFADRCQRSEDVVVNNIVRFHRSIAAAHKESPNAQLYQFTDAAFLVARTWREAILFATSLQHYCLAHNVLAMRKPTAPFDFLIVPRITVARGRALSIGKPSAVDPALFGVAPDKLLAGAAIVKAYYLERSSCGGLVTVTDADMKTIRRTAEFDGDKWSCEVLNRWRTTSSKLFSQRGVRHFPWVLINPNHKRGDKLRGDSRASVFTKIDALHRLLDLAFHNYCSRREPPEVAKHIGGLERHLVELVESLRGHFSIRRVAASKSRTYVSARPKES